MSKFLVTQFLLRKFRHQNPQADPLGGPFTFSQNFINAFHKFANRHVDIILVMSAFHQRCHSIRGSALRRVMARILHFIVEKFNNKIELLTIKFILQQKVF